MFLNLPCWLFTSLVHSTCLTLCFFMHMRLCHSWREELFPYFFVLKPLKLINLIMYVRTGLSSFSCKTGEVTNIFIHTSSLQWQLSLLLNFCIVISVAWPCSVVLCCLHCPEARWKQKTLLLKGLDVAWCPWLERFGSPGSFSDIGFAFRASFSTSTTPFFCWCS